MDEIKKVEGTELLSVRDRGEILKKLSEIQKEIPFIVKGGKNTMQGYKFLSELQITETIKPLLEKHGVMFIPSFRITDRWLTPTEKQYVTEVLVDYEFVDIKTGQSVTGVACGQGSDPNDKGVYKAITGAVKYIFMKTFQIPTGDDPENDSGKQQKFPPQDED